MASTPPRLLQGKTMAITGGATGIGRAIAIAYVSHGANVAVNHLGDSKSAQQFQTLLDEIAETLSSKQDAESRVIEVAGDVSDPETGKKLVGEVVRKWGRLDVFISNAGICEFKAFLEYVLPRPFVSRGVAFTLLDLCHSSHAARTPRTGKHQRLT